MLLKRVIILLFAFVSYCSFGQENGDLTQSRILILLDESSSMLQPWAGSKQKIKVANDIILRLMDSVYAVNRDVEFSLRVFGNQHTVPEHDCTDTKNEVAFSKYNKTQMEFRLEDLHPLGVTAIAYSLSEAAEKDLVDEKKNAYSIILITDGGESCGGDICAVMAKLIRNKVFFKPYILSLEDLPELKSEYACMGDYLPVTKPTDITKAVNVIVEAFRPMLKISKKEYKEIQIKVPSILKVNTPGTTTEPKKDTATKKTIPTPKPVDSVVTTPKVDPKPTKITVGTPAAKLAPLKMSKLAILTPKKLFTNPIAAYKPKPVTPFNPEFKILMPDPVPVKAEAAKLTALNTLPLKKTKLPKFTLSNPQPIDVFFADIKVAIPEPKPVRAATAKLTALATLNIKKIKITSGKIPAAQTISVYMPEIKLPEPEVVKVKATAATLTAMPLAKIKKIKVEKGRFGLPPALAEYTPEVKIDFPVVKPERPATAQLTAAPTARLKKFKTTKPEPFTPPAMPVYIANVPIDMSAVPPPAPKRVVERFAKLKPPAFKMHLLYGGSFFDNDLKPVKWPHVPEYKPAAGTATTTPAKPKPVAKTGEYTVEHEDATQTTLEIYLTNGKGKFFATSPRMVLFEPNSNKEIKKFFRTVDGGGNPDPITNLPAGSYDLTVAGREDLLVHLDMQANKRNKVFIKVPNYSLYFYYEGAENRPVTQFSAMVIQRNVANGKQTVQKCTERLEYEPGNYHIIINTFPEDIRNIDLEATSAGGIAILEPGFVKFTSEVGNGSVVLNKQSGDRFISFYTLKLSDPSSQHLQIQPGRYQVQYNNGTSKFSSADKILTFDIKSNQETEVILKK